VTAVFTLTLWMRLVGATASGWLADRIGRKKPLMISIGWYSVCNFIAGFAPAFWFLFLFRALLGIGMGAEWPCGAALAMETWPIRSRGFMAGVLQASWGLGALLSSAACGNDKAGVSDPRALKPTLPALRSLGDAAGNARSRLQPATAQRATHLADACE
jgi:sugar phosphate permease